MERSWVELRVHGVSGTPPEDLLDSPHVVQVDGDDRSRFFRPVRRPDDGHVLEGFHWGRYTSGSLVQSTWITLLPFGLVNLAAFMLPAPTGVASRLARTAALAALRLLGALLTLLFSLAVTLTLSDVVAVQWLRRQHWAVDWVKADAVPGAMVLSGVLLALFGGWSWFKRLLGRGAAQVRLEDSLPMTPAESRRDDDGPGDGLAATRIAGQVTPFGNPAFYAGDPDTLTLRGLHVALCLLLPALLAAVTADRRWLTMGTTAVMVLVLLVVLFMGDNDRIDPTELTPSWLHRMLWPVVTRLLVLSAVLLLVASALALLAQQSTLAPTERVYDLDPLRRGAIRFDGFILSLVVAVLVTLTLLAAAVVILAALTQRPRRPAPAAYFNPYSGGTAALAVAGLGMLLGVGFSAAVVNGAAIALTGSRASGATSLTDPELLDLVNYLFGVGWLPLAGLVVVVLTLRARHRARLRELADRDFPPSAVQASWAWAATLPRPRVGVWASRLANALWIARLKNAVAIMVWTPVAAGGVLSVLLLLVHFRALPVDGAKAGAADGAPDLPLYRLFGFLGVWTLIGLMAVLVYLVRTGVRDGNVRRGVNIIWDVIAFWPHAVHPFIPEPYSLRAVGDLAQRVRDHVTRTRPEDGHRRLVLCAHSQGSLISFAAMQMLAPYHDRVGLLTFGSQLRVIFPRAFPRYVNHAAISHLYDTLDGAWVNLYRDTDPLAGPVLSWNHTGDPDWFVREGTEKGAALDTPLGTRYGPDWRLIDPAPRLTTEQWGPVDALRAHSYYWSSPAWTDALCAVRTTPVTPDPPPPV